MSRSPSFLEILRRHAAERPASVVFELVDGEGAVALDFAGLLDRVERLGGGLAAHVAPGDRVAICMENRPAWPVAYLSVWQAGGVTVPIDPALEAHAIRRVLEHSGARLCLTSHALGERVVEACEDLAGRPDVYDVDAAESRLWDGVVVGEGVAPSEGAAAGPSWEELIGDAEALSAARGRPDAMATLTYTSGTTGVPKGVVLSEEAIAANVRAGLRRIELTADDAVLGVLPLFHALPMMANFLAPLWVGGRVTYLRELNPDRIIAAFPRHRITTFACVPLFFYRFHDRVMKGIDAQPPLRRRIVRALLALNRLLRRRAGVNLGRRLFGRVHDPFGADLRVFLTGGAKFDPAVYSDFLDLGFPLVQGYGLTEGAAGLTMHPLDQLRPDTVGTALDGIELQIRDPDDDGVGEIVASTPSRMLGYYRNPDATAEVLDGEWLRTGDLGTLEPDGHLRITGRAKDVIVLASGKNIYPEELEAFYGQADIVQEICILGLDDPARRGAERLHAVVVPDLDVARRRGEANVRETVKWEIDGLASRLPPPQRVSSLEIRSEPLPRTTTRKVKRFELKKEIQEGTRAASDAPVDTTAVGPGDGPEWAADVREMVERHTGGRRVRDEDHLDLDLGLESIDRIELQAEIEEAFGVEVDSEVAGAVHTVGDLVELVGELRSAGEPTARTDGDRWERVLAQPVEGVEPYLRGGPLRHLAVRVLAALVRTVQRIWGFRTAGAENLPERYPFLLAPNHLAYADPFVLGLALPPRVVERIFFVGYAGYFEGAVTGRLARLLRTVPIDQNRNLERALQAASEGLRRDMVLGIFPEGARATDGRLQEFRRGIAILARVHGVPVVPVGIWGTYEMWPRNGRFRPHRVAVAFGRPIEPPTSVRGEADFLERLRDRVAELTDRARALYGDA